MIPIRFVSTHRADSGHVDPLKHAAIRDSRFVVVGTVSPVSGNELVFFQGDRTELLTYAAPYVAANCVIAHAAGGERTKGSTDDRVRDAMTKLAHLHYPVHEDARKRLLSLQEEDWRICVAGEVGVDTIMGMGDVELPKPYDRAKRGDRVIAIHPVTSRPEETQNVATATMIYCLELGGHNWIVPPNGDPGSDVICQEYCMLPRRSCTMIDGLTHPQFLTLMKRCGTIIGNSSCLITEAPHLGVLPILIGTRQEGRMPAASDGKACQRILDHMAACWERKDLRVKA